MRQHREEAEEAIDSAQDISTSHIDATDAQMDIEHCLASLTATERTVVLLFYLEDQPIKKIADITSLPQGTIKSHLSRARVKMAKVYNN